MADGLIWWSTPHATVGLLVRDGRVVDASPFARRAVGRDARQVWRLAVRAGGDLGWLPAGGDQWLRVSAALPGTPRPEQLNGQQQQPQRQQVDVSHLRVDQDE
jgi:hypothetical protein